ncbi:MAG: pseudouridine synthase [Lachnospiraceae bacterium]|nr:pseudouridine synthase [Lachnospiraceae bacterium]
MRLDKFLCDLQYGTRSSIKKEIRNGLVSVNGKVIRKSDHQVKEEQDFICYRDIPCVYQKYVYYMLHKPAGTVSATEDKKEKTVISLLKETGRNDLFPVGRLDKDTEGLLILTNDGPLAHELLSPGRHVEKVYECTLANTITEIQKQALEQGVDIGEKRLTLPAKVDVLGEKKVALTITEGKFHQVKRMVKAVGNEVLYLKRVRMGAVCLDVKLKPGEYREMTEEEVRMLKTREKRDTKETGMEARQAEEYLQPVPTLNDVDAVIFDLDGSLVDSMWVWQAIDIEYLNRFGIESPPNLNHMIGGRSFHETAVYIKELFQIPDDEEQIKADWNRMAWDKYSREVPLKNGAGAFIELCMQKRIKLGIATSNSRELVENVIAAHELYGHFGCIMTSHEITKGKPAPDIYLAVASALHVRPERCLVFEDIVPGILAGKAAGMKVCAVYDEASVSQDEEKRRLADYYIHDFKELI